MKAVFLTAGAAGMYCGSCMHDNSLARALQKCGVDCVLQPVYTPIRTDAISIADERVFFGGIHVYLLQRIPWLRHVPAVLLRTLNWPPLLRFATARASSTDAKQLGALSVSMLKGLDGRQSTEVRRLVKWFANDMQPETIVFSNLLIGGAIPPIRDALPDVKMIVILQGDDIFLDHLPEPSRSEAIALCKKLVADIDQFVVHSQFYADKMNEMLDIPADKITVTPLSIDVSAYSSRSESSSKPDEGGETFRLGYLARIAPEKGLHHLIDAFIRLASQSVHADMHLHVAGWLGPANEAYFESLKSKVSDAGLSDRFHHHGSPSLQQKASLLRSLDLLSVPTDYADPKGLFVLESLASGVPVVQPAHGAFTELIESTGGGIVFPPGDLNDLCEAIDRLKSDSAQRKTLASVGEANVRQKHSIETAALQMRQIMFNR